MNAQEEIIKDLRRLSGDFPGLTFRYYVDTLDTENIIEVEPNRFDELELFIDASFNFINNFYLQYPNDSISFQKSKDISFREDLELIVSFNIKSWVTVLKSKPEITKFREAYTSNCVSLNTAA